MIHSVVRTIITVSQRTSRLRRREVSDSHIDVGEDSNPQEYYVVSFDWYNTKVAQKVMPYIFFSFQNKDSNMKIEK
jgi:hypothetical protein